MNFFIRKTLFFKTVLTYKSVHTKMKFKNMTPVIPCDEYTSSVKAVKYLKEGLVIAVPTDTIYGLACSAQSSEAIKKLYSIKGRDSAKPVAICVSSIKDVRKWCLCEHLNDDILNDLLPGPITLLLNKSPNLDNPFLNPQANKIGIRIPNCDFINRVTDLFDSPLALTSANLSNELSTLSVREFHHLYDQLGAVFDGGVLNQGNDRNRTGSTVVDLSDPGFYQIIRNGISLEKIVKIFKKYGLKESH